MINHIHLPTVDSTQTHLLENLERYTQNGPHVAVTTSRQTKGLTREEGRKWDFFEGNMAVSFTLVPREHPTLTAVEVGVLVGDFFDERFGKNLGLKWPNDLFYKGLKCGGVIMKLTPKAMAVGLGLNIKTAPQGAAHLFESPLLHLEEEALGLYDYILKNRPTDSQVLEKFGRRCVHLNLAVAIGEGRGLFRGIDRRGGAILEGATGERRLFYSGSLRVQNL